MALFLRRIAMFLGVTFLTAAILAATGTKGEIGRDDVVMQLSMFGSLVFFFGPYLTGSGFWYRMHWVDSPTPALVWRILGVILWVAALITLLAMSW